MERDIILERLPADEIKRRFNLQVLGPQIVDWLRGITEQVQENQQRLEEFLKSAEMSCAEIEEVPPDYTLEREGRRKELLTKVVKGYEDFRAKHLSLTTLIQEWLKLRRLNRVEFEIISNHVDWLSRVDELLKQQKELVERIGRLRGDGASKEVNPERTM